MGNVSGKMIAAIVAISTFLIGDMLGYSANSITKKYTAEAQANGITFAVQCEVAQLKEGDKRTLVILGVANQNGVGYVTRALVEYSTINQDSGDKWVINRATGSYGATPGGQFPDSGEGIAIRNACIEEYPDLKTSKVQIR